MTKKEEKVLLSISFILNSIALNGHLYMLFDDFNKYREIRFVYIPFIIFSFMACMHCIVRGAYLNTNNNDIR